MHIANRDRAKSSRRKRTTLTRRELAALLKVHPLTVSSWERAGLPVFKRGRPGKASRYREIDVRAWLAAREAAAKESGAVDAIRDRARRERAQAMLAEQTHAIRNRDLVPVAEVEQKLAARVMATRTRLLAWQTTLSDRVFRAATVDGLAGVEAILKNAVYEVLRELAGGVVDGPLTTETTGAGRRQAG